MVERRSSHRKPKFGKKFGLRFLYGLHWDSLSKYKTFNPFLLPSSHCTQLEQFPSLPFIITAVFLLERLARVTSNSSSMVDEASNRKM